jgi:signal transduction histidine kinase
MSKQRLYRLLIAPHAVEPGTRNQEAVLNWLLVGSLVLAFLAFVNAAFTFTVLRETYLWPRLIIIFGLFLLFGTLLAASRRRQQQTVPSIVLLSIFFLSAGWLVYHWGILVPDGVLLFSLVIVIAGMVLNARWSLYAALLATLTLGALEYAKAHHYIRPDLSWESRTSNFSDVASFAAIYAIVALTSWLFNGRMETALTRAKRSEIALKRQRDLLEVKVEQRTRELQAAQLEQIQEVYRFAELGHLSTALFHDLANHLMSVSIDIEGLKKHGHSALPSRIQENIRHIDEVVKRVRRQLAGQDETERFNVVDEIQEVMNILAYQSNSARVTISLEPGPAGRAVRYQGDLTRFRQIIINLLSNAIEAYDKTERRPSTRQPVEVAVAKQSDKLVITVTDHGRAIKPSAQAKIFQPFYTTKEKGMGIGLFIVKKVTEQDFGGTITLTSSKRAGTTFVVTLPLKRHGHRASNPAN